MSRIYILMLHSHGDFRGNWLSDSYNIVTGISGFADVCLTIWVNWVCFI